MIKGISAKWGLLGAAAVVAVYEVRKESGIEATEQWFYIALLLSILALCVVRLFERNSAITEEKGSVSKQVKTSIASFGISWGVYLLVMLLLVPVFGFKVVELLTGPWSLPILIIGAIIALPFVEKRLQ